jgi:2-oxoisovalerate dehydrogenase E1 component alpha subunit|tara:strand:- start:137178 stop:138398 length:1221 start_codon:yes stop_codon:yes gene_type:complete
MRSNSLYIPQPTARPGDNPGFDHLAIPAVGETRRPEIFDSESQMRDMPFGLVRVLDEEGQAVGPWQIDVDPEQLRAGLKAMVKTRLFEDRMFRSHRQGKTSFYIRSTGEEAIGAAQSLVLGKADMCFPTYRMLAWLMARDYPMLDLVNQIFSNRDDPLKGRQLPTLYSARDYGFYSLSGNVGSRIGHGVGWAMASAYRGLSDISIGHIGEGTSAEGDFDEALTFASVYKAPAILCVTNNQWAISSFAGIAGGEHTTFAARGTGHGLPGLRVDANDFLALWSATSWAAERARQGYGATLLELFTYRVAAHSTSDDPTKYRPKEEAGAWPLGDPIARLKQHLIRIGEWDEERHAAMEADFDKEVRQAVKQGEAVGTLGKSKPPVSEMFEGVFEKPDWRVLEQRREMGL